jgi:hypothetical protein
MDVAGPARRCATLLGIAALASCYPAPDDIVVHSPSRTFSARVTVAPDRHGGLGRLEGPLISAEVYGDELRGVFEGSPVSLKLDEGAMRITGLLGDQPVDLRVRRTEVGCHVSGLFAGALSDYDVGKSELRGRIGKCSYELPWTEQGYQGQRQCGDGRIEQVSLQEPQRMLLIDDPSSGLTTTETVAALTLALAR